MLDEKKTIYCGGIVGRNDWRRLSGKRIVATCSLRLALPESYTYFLLFEPAGWLIPLSALLGIFFRASWQNLNGDPELADGKILRHDEHMFLAHWSHALSVLILLASGLVKGPLFLPRLVHTPEAAGFSLNLHFIGIVIFAFGLFSTSAT